MRRVGGVPAPKDGDEPTVDVIVREIETRVVGKRSHSPEHGCLGCIVGMVLVFISLVGWAIVYWYYTPEFHAQPNPLPRILQEHPSVKLKAK